MALMPPSIFDTSWVREAFLREALDYRPTFLDMTSELRRPTIENIKADVAKLRSVSAAGRAVIADRRMAIASVGPWRGVLVIPDKSGRYPAIITKARQEGVTYTTRLVVKQGD